MDCYGQSASLHFNQNLLLLLNRLIDVGLRKTAIEHGVPGRTEGFIAAYELAHIMCVCDVFTRSDVGSGPGWAS